jgi:hypothetical protein
MAVDVDMAVNAGMAVDADVAVGMAYVEMAIRNSLP